MISFITCADAQQILIFLGIPSGRKKKRKKRQNRAKPKEKETALVIVIESPVVQPPVQPLIQSPIQPETEVVAHPQAVPSVQQQQPNIAAVSTPEVSVWTKRRTSVKVTSSGQQTTLVVDFPEKVIRQFG
jgi:hypothetical protein